MRLPRPRRVLAVASREARQDLKGKRWISVPGLLVALLLPASMLPSGRIQLTQHLVVSGDVPEEVLALDGAVAREHHSALRFDDSEPDQLKVVGPQVPDAVRAILDRQRPAGRVTIDVRQAPTQLPHRGLLLALLAASGLTASIASSIGTERSRRTLTTLLSASITPLEIVLGKLATWGGLATVSTVLFIGVAILRDVLDPGWWVLPATVTPAATVALGLWSVRHSADVVSATTTALRVMPLLTMATGVTAVVLAEQVDPMMGALVPFGGAVCAAGEMWTDHPMANALIASASTVVAAALIVIHTAHQLQEAPREPPPGVGFTAVPLPAFMLLLVGFCTTVTPRLWALAGNAKVTEHVTAEQSVGLTAVCCAAGLAALALRHHGARPFLDLRRAPGPALAATMAGSACLALGGGWFGQLGRDGSFLGVAVDALHTGMVPQVALLPALGLIAAEELLFRGVLAPRMGHGPAATAWALAKAPLDPLAALVAGGTLGAVGRYGGPLATIFVRLVWYGLWGQ